MTENPWTYSTECGRLPGADLTGWSVEATDRPIGTVDEHSDETGDAYLVVAVDTWIFGRLLIPAGAVAAVDPAHRTLHLSLTGDQVEDAPQFLADQDLADRQYRDDVVAYYRSNDPCAGGADTL